MHEALLWLRCHNPFYATISIDESILAALPEDGVPIEILQQAVHLDAPFPSLQQSGPADASAKDQGEKDVSDHPYPFRAAVIDVEGEGIDPINLWNAALTGHEKSSRHHRRATRAVRESDEATADLETSQARIEEQKAVEALALLEGPDSQKVLDDFHRKDVYGGVVVNPCLKVAQAPAAATALNFPRGGSPPSAAPLLYDGGRVSPPIASSSSQWRDSGGRLPL